MNKLSPGQVRASLPLVPEWRRRGAVISRTWTLEDFPAALAFVLQVGRLAEAAQHHPDIDIRWNQVTLALTTHDAGGLTARDFELARRCDELSLRPRRRRSSR